MDMQRQIQSLQAQLSELESQHAQRLIDLTTRHRAETEMETERLRANQNQAERTLESRERTHRQRVKGLEEQVATLKDQLGQEMRKRQQYISRSANAGDDDFRLQTSLASIDPKVDNLLLEQEVKRLNESLGSPLSPPTRLAPARKPTRSTSPLRLASTPTAGGRSPRRLQVSSIRRN